MSQQREERKPAGSAPVAMATAMAGMAALRNRAQRLPPEVNRHVIAPPPSFSFSGLLPMFRARHPQPMDNW